MNAEHAGDNENRAGNGANATIGRRSKAGSGRTGRAQAMQLVDDYILGLVFAQQAAIDAQAQQIANLLQRVEQLEGGAGS